MCETFSNQDKNSSRKDWNVVLFLWRTKEIEDNRHVLPWSSKTTPSQRKTRTGGRILWTIIGRCCEITVNSLKPQRAAARSTPNSRMKVGKFMRMPICLSHARFVFPASRFNLLVRARTRHGTEIILLRRGNANSHAPNDIHNTTPLIPHCLRVPSPLHLDFTSFFLHRHPPIAFSMARK